MRIMFGLIGALLAFLASTACAQNVAYPTKSVRVLVGFAPGGGVDVMARLMALKLSESLKQNFVVENRPGAVGNIATELTAKSAPDGYTLLMTSIVHCINATLFTKLPFDPVRDFQPVGSWAFTSNGIAVHPSVPVRNLAELVALAKQKPGALTYASAGGGTMMHVGMELFLSTAGIQMLHVPYNGSGPSTLAVVGGQVPVLSTSLGIVLPHARAGKLRLLAVSSAKSTPLAPDIPAVADAAGLPGYEAISWVGLLAPAGTPTAVVARLNSEIGKMLASREIQEQLAVQAWDPFPNTTAVFAERIRSDIQRWGRIVKESGVKAD